MAYFKYIVKVAFRNKLNVIPLTMPLLSNVVSSTIYDRKDIEDLFPEMPITFQLKKMVILSLIGMLYYVFFFASSYIIGLITDGPGTLMYPINIYDSTFVNTSPLFLIVLKATLLQSLSILFVILFVYLFSVIATNALTTLFVYTVLLVGPILLTGQIGPIYKYLHLFPTTYFNAISVVTNNLAYETDNTAITLNSGVIVLLVFFLLFMSVILVYKTTCRSREMMIQSSK
ncbi:hypothetical protein A5886_000956 [Enterococcus sp. 8G7_MSG3316]|uniref:ABC-2 type transporter domain-containing protein n=1 Tax=Candidatus Enterococcus testudinis TaxID=1834191 RepID=A0A242A4Q7_9ENTE|nr:hypothetical protein [Enterococcus sp. 8G7_MSG3316]OTN75880.1 hypothetical protein A5886_000956 [Enterococcus sp. 8G7_MSG3316]